MRVDRFYTTAENGSAFDVIDVPVEGQSTDSWGNAMRFSERFDSPGVRVFEAPVGAYQSWHNAPQRQFCVVLEGIWEVGTTDGEKRRWAPGEVFLPDTVHGRGHTSEVIAGPVRILFVPIPPSLDIEQWRVE